MRKFITLKGCLFLWVLGMGYVILLWYSLSLPYNYFDTLEQNIETFKNLGKIFVTGDMNSRCGECTVIDYFNL